MAKASTSSTSLDPTLIDAASLFDASEVIAERAGRAKVTIDYTKLRACLDSLRVEHMWRPATLNTILLSIDPNSEGQQRFQSMLRHAGFEPDVVHYRDTYVSVPPGRSPNEMSGKPVVSLAPRIAYIAGLMSRHPAAHFLVVAHSFELFGPLSDLRHRMPEGKVAIAYFASLLDYRWKAAGLFDGKVDIEFFDLDPFGDELLGVDLESGPSSTREARSAFSRF